MGYNHTARPSRWTLLFGGLLGAIAVALGAWGTHGLRGSISSGSYQSFMVAVRYQLIHAAVITALGWSGIHGRVARSIVICLIAGTVLFSGSIFGLVLTDGMTWLGPVTPTGGVLLIVGWVLIAFHGGRRLVIYSAR